MSPKSGKPEKRDKRLRVNLAVSRPKEVLDRWYPNGKLGGLMIDGALPGTLATTCELVVRVAPAEAGKPALHFNVRGQLSWARHKTSRGLRECFGVDFVPEDDAGRQRLLAFAREEVDPAAGRFEERVFVELPVRVTHDGKAQKERLADLSQGGAFVRTTTSLPVGAEVGFEVRPPGALLSLRLKGRVVWVRSAGDDQGVGIVFLYESAAQAERVRKLLSRLEK
jgi:uncharacterized protein (TIGR02266 family)